MVRRPRELSALARRPIDEHRPTRSRRRWNQYRLTRVDALGEVGRRIQGSTTSRLIRACVHAQPRKVEANALDELAADPKLDRETADTAGAHDGLVEAAGARRDHVHFARVVGELVLPLVRESQRLWIRRSLERLCGSAGTWAWVWWGSRRGRVVRSPRFTLSSRSGGRDWRLGSEVVALPLSDVVSDDDARRELVTGRWAAPRAGKRCRRNEDRKCGTRGKAMNAETIHETAPKLRNFRGHDSSCSLRARSRSSGAPPNADQVEPNSEGNGASTRRASPRAIHAACK